MPTDAKAGVVRALWGASGADRPDDALKRLHEALANEDLKGVILITVGKDGKTDSRIYGEVWRQEMTWVGSQLVVEAHND